MQKCSIPKKNNTRLNFLKNAAFHLFGLDLQSEDSDRDICPTVSLHSNRTQLGGHWLGSPDSNKRECGEGGSLGDTVFKLWLL